MPKPSDMMTASSLLVLLATAALPAGASSELEPARFASGRIPGLPPLASNGGLPVVELEVAPSGIVIDSIILDDAPPFSDAILEQTTLWRFHPARANGRAVATRVLVMGVFLPPVLIGGGDGISPAEKLASASIEAPYPNATSIPSYPPNALYEGVAAVQVLIDPTGKVLEASMVSPENGFDELALEHAGKFEFRPAKRGGQNVHARALILFGFRQPLTRPGRPRRD